MQHETRSPETWLAYANSDLSSVKNAARSETSFNNLYQQAQEAAEKAIKAVLIYSGIYAPKTFNIEQLVELLPRCIDRNPLLIYTNQITCHVVKSKYSITEYDEAIRFAETVIAWAERIVM